MPATSTTAVTGNGYVNTEGGYDRGLHARYLQHSYPARRLLYVLLALAHEDQPMYLFLGKRFDTHGRGCKPWIDLYSPGPYHGPFQDMRKTSASRRRR